MVHAQNINEKGARFIRNFSEKEYHGLSQNWSIIQDQRGIIYVGNNGGVLIYDGASWRIIKMPNNSVVRALAQDSNNVIYVGAVNEFGYLTPDQTGKLTFQSLRHHLDSTHRSFKSVWKVHATQKGIYFYTDNFLARWHNNEFTYWHPEGKYFFLSYQVNDDLYIFEKGIGLMYLDKNDSLVSFKNQDKIKEAVVYSIIPYDDERLFVGTLKDGMFLMQYDKNFNCSLEKLAFSHLLDPYLIDNQFYHCSQLGKNNYVLSTLRDGIVVINKQGKILERINTKNGLFNDQVWYTFVDNMNNIWLGLNSGLSMIEWNMPIHFFDEDFGLKGTVLSILRYKGILFVSTSQGVYYWKDNVFKELEGFKRHNWNLFIYNQDKAQEYQKLLLASTYGIFEILVNQNHISAERRTGFNGTVYCFYQLRKDPEIVLAGLNDGIGMFRITDDTFGDFLKIEEITQQVREIQEDEDDNIWAQTTYSGVLKIVPDQYDFNDLFTSDNDPEFMIVTYGTESGLPSVKDINIKDYCGKIYFTTPKGIYQYDELNDKFYPDPGFGEVFADGSTGVFHFAPDRCENIWITANSYKSFSEIIIPDSNNTFIRDTISLRRIPFMDIQAIYHDPSGISYMGGSDGLYTFNANEVSIPEPDFHALIREVTVNNDSLVFSGNPIKFEEFHIPEIYSFDYQYNSLQFHFASTYFAPASENLYSYYLKGFKSDKNWSAWTKETKKEYTNLHPGSYTFYVKSKNVLGFEGTIDAYSFEILPPWYRTYWAYIIYVILFILLFRLGVRVYTRQLKLANIQLEKTIRERTLLIRKKNEELESQKEEITDSILYAKRIQNAFLPTRENIEETLKEYFILDMPKSIVSGDFHWVSRVDGKTVVAVADCTGHGVPGAFMSLIGISILNKIINEKGYTDPDEILNRLKKNVIYSLHQTGKSTDANDGMDISVLTINPDQNSIDFAGAMNSFYLVRDDTLLDFKGDKMPIGFYEFLHNSYSKKTIKYQPGDTIYMFTDGFADQFGGDRNQKFRYKNFKNLLIEASKLPIKDQRKYLEHALLNWMGKNEQVDDILIVGFKI